MRHNPFLTACIVLLLTACNSPTVYHAFQALPSEGWMRGDTLCFEVEVTDSLATYHLEVEVRNRNDYTYLALPISVCCEASSSAPLLKKILELTLNDGNGKWTGAGYGNLSQTSIQVGTIPIDSAGIYRVKIAHNVPDECLRGISDIGIKLYK